MDHPGFEVAAERGGCVGMEIHGGAPRAGRGASVRLFAPDRIEGIPATVLADERRVRGRRWFSVRARCTGPTFAMWNLPPYRRAGHRVHARVIDDLAGCAAILAAMERLREQARGSGTTPDAGPGGPSYTMACFTRAEEVGFVGATALATSGRIPRDAVVVSVEMSRMLPGAEPGRGLVVRVGDRRSIFDPDATQALTEVAAGIAAGDGSFRYQRRILDGGTCEATAFRALGYRATGLACPLGNYHNQGPRGVAPEYIDIRDWRGLVRLIAAAAIRLPAALAGRLETRRRVMALYDAYKRKL
jgi:endoglucanase